MAVVVVVVDKVRTVEGALGERGKRIVVRTAAEGRHGVCVVDGLIKVDFVGSANSRLFIDRWLLWALGQPGTRRR